MQLEASEGQVRLSKATATLILFKRPMIPKEES
jgi:hypothetical protein